VACGGLDGEGTARSQQVNIVKFSDIHRSLCSGSLLASRRCKTASDARAQNSDVVSACLPQNLNNQNCILKSIVLDEKHNQC
jgi:hypothetical protein